ncbi:MAG: hypothetical protein DMG05_13700 [Acidobacteria bacterium]|nr:MAG: hypothetical protein DMG05_13700 [Acidobacteriota bacterium]
MAAVSGLLSLLEAKLSTGSENKKAFLGFLPLGLPSQWFSLRPPRLGGLIFRRNGWRGVPIGG